MDFYPNVMFIASCEELDVGRLQEDRLRDDFADQQLSSRNQRFHTTLAEQGGNYASRTRGLATSVGSATLRLRPMPTVSTHCDAP